MLFTYSSALALLLGVSPIMAAPSYAPAEALRPVAKREAACAQPSNPPPAYCQHSAQNRQCWSNGFDINTDYEKNVPRTGKTRTYHFEVTEHDNYVSGDGEIKKKAMLINGQFPGPTVVADWGDMIEVHVTNKLEINGTSLHWHGIRMLNNCVNDGANGVTECPLPPGASKTYRFLAEQYGSSWYHSHFGSQYANGAVGTILINGPATRNYDIDLGVFPLSDWYYGSSDEIQYQLNHGPPRGPPPSDNVLFNGSHVSHAPNSTVIKGEYARVKLTPGKKHRLRLINTSVDNSFSLSLVDHSMTVIQADFIPVEPFAADSLYLTIGQRYDVIIEGKPGGGGGGGAFWFNATLPPSGLCGTSKVKYPAAIFQYEDGDGNTDAAAIPTNPGVPPADSKCTDLQTLKPVVQRHVPPREFATASEHGENELPVRLDPTTETVTWDVRGMGINITWDKPTLGYVAKGQTDFPGRYNIFKNPYDEDEREWSFWIVQNEGAIPHPMHLHGHDFLIIGQSAPVANPFTITLDQFHREYAFDATKHADLLKFANPPRRDTTMLPGWGWLIIAFRTDNPGAWLLHCHIAWHVSQGLGIQFLERVGDIPATVPLEEMEPNCAAWTDYWDGAGLVQFDSGL